MHIDLDKFVEQRLIEPPDSEKYTNFNAPLKRNKAQTFSSLYAIDPKKTSSKQTAVKADRNILQRLVTAY